MPKFFSELQEASLENLASDPSGTVAGKIWHNTTEVRVKTDDGTDKRALLRNDQKCVIGNNATPANNIRIHRGAAGVVQLVSGADTTAEGTLSTALNQISARIENYSAAGKPSAANAGRMIWETDTSLAKIDTGSTYLTLGPNPTTTKGDLLVHNGTSDIRLGVGADGTVLKANSAQTAGVEWASSSVTPTVRSVTSTDTATTADDILILSDASFTQTLFTAVGNTGKILEIYHNGTSISQVYTIDTTSSQTIGAALTYTLTRKGEKLKVVSDGSNWVILDESRAYFFNGYHDSTSEFTETNTGSPGDGDFVADASVVLVTYENTIGTVIAEASGFPGITVTPTQPGTYKVTALPELFHSATGGRSALWLVDGSGTEKARTQYHHAANATIPVPLVGYFQIDSGSFTAKIRASTSSGTLTIGHNVAIDSDGPVISWLIERVGR